MKGKSLLNSFFILLIGTKGDLRNQENVDTITFKECKKMKKKVKAYKYVECSALKCENLEEVFTEAIRAVLKKPSSKLCCSFWSLTYKIIIYN